MRASGADYRVALVGLVGALIGGLMSTAGVLYSERAQDRRDDAHERREAAGAARLLVDEFRTVGLWGERSLQTNKLQPVPPDAVVRLTSGERKVIAMHMSSDGWGRASEAAANANLTTRTFARVDRGLGPFRELAPAEAVLIDTVLTEVTQGREALRPLTGETPAVTPTPPLRRLQALPGPPGLTAQPRP